jgi:GH15 family glucan-1,4-alpha-glucosidase
MFERLLGLQNDLGLLSEEYDPIAKRQLGNFPQAFTHLALVNAARVISGDQKMWWEKSSGTLERSKD